MRSLFLKNYEPKATIYRLISSSSGHAPSHYSRRVGEVSDNRVKTGLPDFIRQSRVSLGGVEAVTLHIEDQ
jgi:hypothetical protein